MKKQNVTNKFTYSCLSRGKLGSTSSQSLRPNGLFVANISVFNDGSIPKESVILGRAFRSGVPRNEYYSR